MISAAEKELFLAIRANDGGAVRELVRQDRALLGAVSPLGVSPVLFAVYYGHPAMAQLLVQEGAPLNVFEAAATGDLERVRGLLDSDPGLTGTLSPDGFSPLGLAALFGQTEVAALLVLRGADVNVSSENAMQVRPLHSAVAGFHAALAQLLLDAGADASAAQPGGFTPLMAAAQNGDAALVRALLVHGAQAGARNEAGHTAADLAQEEGHGEVLILLG